MLARRMTRNAKQGMSRDGGPQQRSGQKGFKCCRGDVGDDIRQQGGHVELIGRVEGAAGGNFGMDSLPVGEALFCGYLAVPAL